jgi:hypothetical protein
MPDLNLNGKIFSLDNDTAKQIENLASGSDLEAIVNEYWTKEKLGKHPELKKDYLEIVEKCLLVEPDLFKSDLFKNRIKLRNLRGPLNGILINSKLNGDLRPNYIKMCLDVTTSRPAIGKGEFLFVASFANLGFSSGRGDLVDLNTKERIEVKGVSAVLGNAQSGRFRQMSGERMWTIFRELGINDVARSDYYLSEENAKKIKQAIGLDRDRARTVLTHLQNLRNENESLARASVDLYFDKKQLIRTVAAVHLYSYMRVEQDDYLLILNDSEFSLFKSPSNLYEAYEIVNALSVKPWHQGEYGIKVTLR